MKVAFLIHSMEVNSCRYRILQYLPYLEEKKVDISILFYQRRWSDRLKLYRDFSKYDILYVHRKLFLPFEFWYIRKKAKKIIYDFDDALMYRSSSAKKSYSLSRRSKFAYMMKRVDFIIAGNQFLNSEAMSYNRNTKIIPTSIDLNQYTPKKDYHKEGPITIGWIGSSSTLQYLKRLMPILENIFKKYQNIELKVVCDEFVESNSIPIIKKRWNSDEEEADLKSFDIGVMPLVDDLWARGKCGLKILQYFCVGVPAVCSPVGVNRDIVEDKVNGFWAQNDDQWINCLLRLIKEEKLRKEMGLKGRETVEKGYSIQTNAPRILDTLNKVIVI
ncbi:MAG: glycosyltransferase family 4 protein [Bacteroidales bacterium]|nr:glycosyltransferase family 4 protein [Bacteroidales bacterium]